MINVLFRITTALLVWCYLIHGTETGEITECCVGEALGCSEQTRTCSGGLVLSITNVTSWCKQKCNHFNRCNCYNKTCCKHCKRQYCYYIQQICNGNCILAKLGSTECENECSYITIKYECNTSTSSSRPSETTSHPTGSTSSRPSKTTSHPTDFTSSTPSETTSRPTDSTSSTPSETTSHPTGSTSSARPRQHHILQTLLHQHLPRQHHILLTLRHQQLPRLYPTDSTSSASSETTSHPTDSTSSTTSETISLTTGFTSSTPSEATSHTSGSTSSEDVGGIVGGIVGGLLVGVIVGIVIFLIKRLLKTPQSNHNEHQCNSSPRRERGGSVIEDYVNTPQQNDSVYEHHYDSPIGGGRGPVVVYDALYTREQTGYYNTGNITITGT